MNLFILDTDPVEAAKQNCDSHVCKIILEVADMLCLSHWENGGLPSNAPPDLLRPKMIIDKRGRVRTLYKYRATSQVNNHVSKWVRASRQNYLWTVEHGIELCRQYELRYWHNLKKRGMICHAARPFIEWFGSNIPTIPDTELHEFRQAVARTPYDCYRQDDPVTAYKEYYVRYKARFAKWRLGNIPEWFIEMSKLVN